MLFAAAKACTWAYNNATRECNTKAQWHEIHKRKSNKIAARLEYLICFVRRIDIPDQHAGLLLCVLKNNVLHVVQHRTWGRPAASSRTAYAYNIRSKQLNKWESERQRCWRETFFRTSELQLFETSTSLSFAKITCRQCISFCSDRYTGSQ